MKKTNNVFLLFIMAFIFITLMMSVEGCATMGKDKAKSDIIRSISFSPDGKKIMFDRRKGDAPSMIHVYNLATGELSAYRSPNGEQWNQARYSFDGKNIVFQTMPYDGNRWDIANSQIAIMAPDGGKARKMTSSTGYKIYPSFSHSGKKIIYTKASNIRHTGKTPAMDYDIHEVDLENGKETRLTWFKFFMMSPPFYFPDDERIIFSAYGAPRMFPSVADNDNETIREKQDILKTSRGRQSLDDDIYIIRKGQKELPEPFIKSKDGLRNPLLTKDGVVFFKTQAYKQDGKGDWSQYFQYDANGKHRRITNLKATTIWSGDISNDGEMLAIVYDIAPAREINKIVIYQVKDGTSKEITLPDQPTRIINP